ncbi:MAG: hypothetical protein EOO43_23225, partial [Flavobacterium sp.]
MKTLLTSIITLILFLGYKGTSTREISGTITSGADGSVLQDVSIQSFPSKTSAKTDEEGNYRIKIPITDTHIQVAYIGYQTKNVTIGKSNTINIILAEDVKALKEIAVVGYGTVHKRSDITSSSSTHLASSAVVTSEALSGRV